MSKKRAPTLNHGALSSIGAALLCVLIGLAIGFVALVILSWVTAAQNAAASGASVSFAEVIKTAYSSGFRQILMGGFYMSPIGIGREIATAAPLIMCGLSVGFAFKTGLFNIGAAGQYTLGAFGGLFCAIVLGWPWWACLIAATLFGAFWGAIPGVFKALLNINEVITSIMFNWIGLYAVNTIMYGGGSGVMYDANKTKTWVLRDLYPKSVIPDLGLGTFFKNRSTTIAVFLAIIVAVIVYIVINKTTFGYELKACGFNRSAAKYAGINEKKSIIMSMVIAGALAGFGGGLYYLSGVAEWSPMNSTALPAMGFNGIAVALLASSNPIGTIFSAVLIAHITTGGSFMTANIFPPEISSVISGIIIYLCAFSLLFKGWIEKLVRGRRKAAAEADAAADEPPEEPPAAQNAPPEAASEEKEADE